MNPTVIPKERFRKSFETLLEAYHEAGKSENAPKFAFFRDSVVQRFEYTIESAWKYLRVILEERDGIEDLLSPKKVLQEALKYGYIRSIDGWYEMLTARNITSHDYGLHHSENIYESIHTYISLLQDLYDTTQR